MVSQPSLLTTRVSGAVPRTGSGTSRGGASRSPQGRITLSVVNLDPERAAKIAIDLRGMQARSASGRVVTAKSMDARPGFGQPDPLAPIALDSVRLSGGVVSFVAPAKSVSTLEIH